MPDVLLYNDTERSAALHRALECVPEHEQRLMWLMLREPHLSYDEISATLGIPKGSIGPTRGRCLARLRVLLEASWSVSGNVRSARSRTGSPECATALLK